MLTTIGKQFRIIYTRERRSRFLNIACLSTGMACCLVLGLYLFNELTYDLHFEGHDNIYRVASETTNGSSTRHLAQVYFQVGENLAADNPQVLDYASFMPLNTRLFRVNDLAFFWDGSYGVQGDVFGVFNVEPVFGDVETAMENPGAAAVSESFARAYFGNQDPVGKVIASDSRDYQITLVFRDLPENSHLKFDVLVNREPVNTASEAFRADFVKGGPTVQATDFTYLRMADDFRREDFSIISSRYYEAYLQRFEGLSANDWRMRYYLEPLASIHYHSITEFDLPRGSIFYLYSFVGIVLLVLAVSCANYVNFSTASFEHRNREVKIRQLLGAGRIGLFLRYFFEAQALAFASMLVAVLLVATALELLPLDAILGSAVRVDMLFRPAAIAALLACTFIVGSIAGIYPAMEQARSGFGHLARKLKDARKRTYVRFSLLFLQLAISIGVISTTLLMHAQIEFVGRTPLGFDESNKIVVEIRGIEQIDKLSVLLDSLNGESSISSVTYSENMPGQASDTFTMFGQLMARERVHYSYVDALGLDVVRGRNFTAADFDVEDYDGSPDRVVLINETAERRARALGVEDPVGFNVGTYRVVGVINDYRMYGRQKNVEPLIMYLDKPRWDRKTAIELASQRRFLIAGFHEDGYDQALSTLKQRFSEVYPNVPFQSILLRDHLARAALDDVRQMTLITVFGCLCILMSVTGLYSLASFSTMQRAHEITIRKVLGATACQIVLMLCRGLFLLTIVAGVAASICSYWIVNEWLEGFHYQQHINLLVYFVATMFIACVAVATVALHSGRMALSSPAPRLRYE